MKVQRLTVLCHAAAAAAVGTEAHTDDDAVPSTLAAVETAIHGQVDADASMAAGADN